MPFAVSQGARIYWRTDGAADKPLLVLLNSIGCDLSLHDPVTPLLTPDFRVLRIDTRGHGARTRRAAITASTYWPTMCWR